MALYMYEPVANGLRTDHPIPDLPFVDDSRIPVEDPDGIAAIGRKDGGRTWGRRDMIGHGEGWVAYTTDPVRNDLAWCIRWHPEHGRSVILYRDKDAASVYTVYAVMERRALLFRAGGYWWDGTTWYRPDQVWDAASEKYYRRKVPAAAVVTAADLLTSRAVNADGAAALSVEEVDADSSLEGQWIDHLALWGRIRGNPDSFSTSVVTLTAPELSAGQMVTVAGMADISGIAASTLRAYVSRGEADVPLPQAIVNGRSLWARPVAEEWAEQRLRSDDGVTEAVSASHPGRLIPGAAEIRDRFTRLFFARLWESPAIRKRWALRWRTEAAVHDVAEGLSWDVAVSLERLIPVNALADTVRHAVIGEFRDWQERMRRHSEEVALRGRETAHADCVDYPIMPSIACMLGWLVRHDPAVAGSTINGIIGEAERDLGISRGVSEYSLRSALSMDGDLDREVLNQFLNRVFTPAHETAQREAAQ